MEFRQLEAFVSVVKYRSFTKAAEKNFVSQPTISSHIRALEEELQEQLLVRSTRTVQLTPRGQEFYEYALDILKIRGRMMENVRQHQDQIIHIGASTIPSAYVLPEILLQYRKSRPDIRFSVYQNDSQGILSKMRDGVCDLGVIGMQCEEEEFVCTRLCKDHMVIVTPYNDYFLALKEQAESPIKKLLQCPIILREEGSGSQRIAESFLNGIGIGEEDLDVVLRINDQQAVKNLVAGGFAVSIMSRRAVGTAQQDGQLLVFSLPEKLSSRYFYLVYRRGLELKEHVKDFAAFLRSRLSGDNGDMPGRENENRLPDSKNGEPDIGKEKKFFDDGSREESSGSGNGET